MFRMGLQAIGFREALSTLRSVKTGWSGDARYVVGVGAEYGAYVEFGTSKMRAQPYLFPAANEAVAADLPRIEQAASNHPDPIEFIVAELAKSIERRARQNAPVETGNLMRSIEAKPAGAFS